MNGNETELVALLKETFPHFATLPSDCWVSEAIDANQWDFGLEIGVVTESGGRRDVIHRLGTEHPRRELHLDEHNDRLLDVFTEIEAFAWAREVAGLGDPEFVLVPGCPDLKVADWWVEAKAINRSAEAKAQANRDRRVLKQRGFLVRTGPVYSTPDGLLRKFQYQFDDSVKKWERQKCSGRLVTFLHLVQIDSFVEREGTREQIRNGANSMERSSGTAIVVCENWRWRNPLYCGLA